MTLPPRPAVAVATDSVSHHTELHVDPGLDRIADVLDHVLFGLALADAAGQTGDFCYPAAVFEIGIDHDLSHHHPLDHYRLTIGLREMPPLHPAL